MGRRERRRSSDSRDGGRWRSKTRQRKSNERLRLGGIRNRAVSSTSPSTISGRSSRALRSGDGRLPCTTGEVGTGDVAEAVRQASGQLRSRPRRTRPHAPSRLDPLPADSAEQPLGHDASHRACVVECMAHGLTPSRRRSKSPSLFGRCSLSFGVNARDGRRRGRRLSGRRLRRSHHRFLGRRPGGGGLA